MNKINLSIKWAEEYKKQYIQAIDGCLIRLIKQAIKDRGDKKNESV